MFGGKLPHEFGRLPLTYFQTLVDRLAAHDARENSPARNGSGHDDEDVELVDVDALIRKGQRKGFTAP
jgi:hypothetical protein